MFGLTTTRKLRATQHQLKHSRVDAANLQDRKRLALFLKVCARYRHTIDARERRIDALYRRLDDAMGYTPVQRAAIAALDHFEQPKASTAPVNRIHLDHLTSSDLDALYSQLEEATMRLAAAEAGITAPRHHERGAHS